ncbi:MAG TPA: PDZ domain-containing protein [Pyrinomonadaceae bacterium]|nr:PDZ domain-containing protein [Pyrinomonadaceae bacterium]
MTIKKLLLTLSIVISCGLVVGGIVYAQEAPKAPEAPKAQAQLDVDDAPEFDFDFDMQDPVAPEADRTFTLFLGGGTFLGVHAEDVSKENMARYNMREVRGVGVTQIVKDSPAEKAGLRKDDVILSFNGEAVTSTRKLNRLVSESSADQNVRLTISRGGSEQEISATLGKRESMNTLFNKQWNDKWNTELRQKIEKMQKDFPKGKDGTWTFTWSSHRRIGVSTQPLSKQLAEYFGVTEGILITSVTENSPAAKAGLKAGDIITAVDGEKVDSPGDVSRVINKKQEGSVTLTVVRDRNTRSVTVTPEKPPQSSGGSADTRTIVVPRIEIPVVPAVNVQVPQIYVPQITVPQISVPVVPAINVVVPKTPRVFRRGVVII